MAKDLQIDSRIVEQLAKATVKNLVDGIVELVTNSDDSYRRIEKADNDSIGEIEIYVNRKKGGICENLKVIDMAGGMTKEELEKAIVYGGETSGFESGKSVRGFFGRGLKETIIALGEGEIKTVKNGKLSLTRIWLDGKTKKPQYDDDELGKTVDTDAKNGTEINILVKNEKLKIPELKNFKKQLSCHYSLRDINSTDKRKIGLIFEDLRRKEKTIEPITFKYPKGEKVIEEEISIPKFNDKCKIIIYESPTSLDSPRNNPFGLAGILIKTGGAILDNQLFKFENEPASQYFFGEAVLYGLEERLRGGESEIIDPNRGGLEWRHEYCQALSRSIELILEPLILEKNKAIESIPKKEIKKTTKKMLKELCNLLNGLAKEEFDDLPEVPTEIEPNITNLIIKPEVANILKDKPRVLSIYAPKNVVEEKGTEAHITSNNKDIRPLASLVTLDRHSKYRDKIWFRNFKVVGIKEGAEGNIIVTLGGRTTISKIKVAPQKQRKRGKIHGRRGGFISDIIPNELVNPPQRVVFIDGVIKVYVKFPSVSNFIKGSLEGIETPEGRLLLAELVGEAFCKELARQGIENGKYPKVAGAEIDSFNAAVNELQKKYLHKIQKIIYAWKF